MAAHAGPRPAASEGLLAAACAAPHPLPPDWPNRFRDETLAQYHQTVLVGDLLGSEAVARSNIEQGVT